MTVVLEAPLTGGFPRPGEGRDEPLLTAERYMRGGGMGRWHRPRSGTRFAHDGHVVYRLWCGQHIHPAHGHITADQPPEGEPVCGTCEGRSIGAGQDEWPVQGKTLLFSPHRLTAPRECPGSRREDLCEEVSRSVARCLACGEVTAGRCYGGSAYCGPLGWGPVRHAPGPELVTGCPFHAWRYLVRRGGVVACSCRFGSEEASA